MSPSMSRELRGPRSFIIHFHSCGRCDFSSSGDHESLHDERISLNCREDLPLKDKLVSLLVSDLDECLSFTTKHADSDLIPVDAKDFH